MAECNQCHQPLVDSYVAVVEVVQSGEVIRKASLFGLHQCCARDWVKAEAARLREQYGDDANASVLSRLEAEH